VKKLIAILGLSLLAACAATSKFAPFAEDLPAMQAKVQGITYDEAMQGYKLYISHCSNCHRLHNPKEYSSAGWNKILPEMFEKAKISNPDQQQLIRNYLTAKSK
jgi:hypothetical protein